MSETLEEVPHSLMGPSSFERVENCPSSVLLSMGMDPMPASEYAAEGTVAHHVLEQCLKHQMMPWEFIGNQYTAGEFTFTVDGKMADFLQDVLDYVRHLAGNTPIEIEIKLSLPGTPVYGYTDVGMPQVMPIRICDLKYGAGIEVDESTPQLGIYGLMMTIREHGETFLFDGDPDQVLVIAHILQPRGRRQPFRKHEWTRAALIDLHSRVRRLVDEVAMRRYRYKAGKHCRFCPAVPVCPHLRALANDPAMLAVVNDPDLMMTSDELNEWLNRIEGIDLFIKRINGLAYNYLKKGGYLQDHKLVPKRGKRAWINPVLAEKWLVRKLGQKEAFNSKLKSPTQAEEILPRDLADEMATYVEKTAPGYTLAPRTDPRKEVKLTAEKGAAVMAQRTARRILQQAGRPQLKKDSTDE